MKRVSAAMAIGLLGWGAALAGEEIKTSPMAPNPDLKNVPAQELKVLVPAYGHKADANVLDFAGMVYDHHRQKVLAFGGGHATEKFPNSVHEFDLATLKWTALTPDVPPGEYIATNSVRTKDGQKLGGVKWQGKIWAGSRHTYDGLIMLPDKDLMVCVQGQEFPSGACPPDYGVNYNGGSGLWTFDPVKKEWSVSEKAGLAVQYSVSDVSALQPDKLYYYCAQGYSDFLCLDLKTMDTKKLKAGPKATDMSMTWYPEKDSFFAFPCNEPYTPKDVCRKVYEYSPAADAWTEHHTEGDAPNTYAINVAYDSTNKVFVCFSDHHCFYLSPVENKWYKLEKVLPIANRLYHHHIYDSADNVHILVGDKWDTYAYRLSNDPGKLPGTGLSAK